MTAPQKRLKGEIRRSMRRGALLAGVAVSVLLFSSGPQRAAGFPFPPTMALADTASARPVGPAADPVDSAAATPADTARVTRVDTAAAPERKAPWTMDELKLVLGSETRGVGGGKEYKERKSGRVAMACALLFPGLGQMYNEKPLKAALAAGAEWYYVNNIILNRRLREREKDIRDGYPVDSYQWRLHDQLVTEYWERSVDWIWWTGATMVVILIDAYVDAHLDDMRFEVEARRVDGGAGVGLVFRY